MKKNYTKSLLTSMILFGLSMPSFAMNPELDPQRHSISTRQGKDVPNTAELQMQRDLQEQEFKKFQEQRRQQLHVRTTIRVYPHDEDIQVATNPVKLLLMRGGFVPDPNFQNVEASHQNATIAPWVFDFPGVNGPVNHGVALYFNENQNTYAFGPPFDIGAQAVNVINMTIENNQNGNKFLEIQPH